MWRWSNNITCKGRYFCVMKMINERFNFSCCSSPSRFNIDIQLRPVVYLNLIGPCYIRFECWSNQALLILIDFNKYVSDGWWIERLPDDPGSIWFTKRRKETTISISEFMGPATATVNMKKILISPYRVIRFDKNLRFGALLD